jgi:hypothetical protein
MTDPKIVLLDGVEILKPVLSPKGFQFQFRGEGLGAGGRYAGASLFETTGESNCISDTVLDLLIITLLTGEHRTSHTCRNSARGNGVVNPGFSDDLVSPFRDLAHDLEFAQDFLSGSAAVLRSAAEKRQSKLPNAVWKTWPATLVMFGKSDRCAIGSGKESIVRLLLWHRN